MKKLLLSILLLASVLFADDDDYFTKRKSGVKAVTNQLYLNECGSCHFAF